MNCLGDENELKNVGGEKNVQNKLVVVRAWTAQRMLSRLFGRIESEPSERSVDRGEYTGLVCFHYA